MELCSAASNANTAAASHQFAANKHIVRLATSDVRLMFDPSPALPTLSVTQILTALLLVSRVSGSSLRGDRRLFCGSCPKVDSNGFPIGTITGCGPTVSYQCLSKTQYTVTVKQCFKSPSISYLAISNGSTCFKSAR
jgi:hypothetical protein